MPESLLLTAACLWLTNSLHARPEDGPAACELMRAVLPITEADEDMEIAAYNPRRHAEWIPTHDENHLAGHQDTFLQDEQEVLESLSFAIPCHGDGYVFLRRIMHAEHDVPRMRAGGNGLSPHAFKFWFDNMSREDVSVMFFDSLS